MRRYVMILLVGAQALVLITQVARTRMGDDRAQDFLAFYAAGRVVREYGFGAAYDLELQRQEQAKAYPGAAIVLPFLRPPFLLPLLALVALDNYRASYALWCSVLFTALLIATRYLYKLFRLERWDRESAALGAANCALFAPVVASFAQGQDTIIALAGVLMWTHYLLKGEDTRAGVWLVLCALKPQLMLPLAFVTLRARPRAFWSWFGASAILAILCLALVGPYGIKGFLNALLLSGRGEGYGLNQDRMHNLLGLLLRLRLPYAHLFAWAAYIAAITLPCLLWRRLDMWRLGASGLATTFLSVHLHYHDLSFLILPVVACVVLATRRGVPPTKARMYPALASLCLFLSLIPQLSLLFAAPLCLMLTLAALLYLFRSSPSESDTGHSSEPSGSHSVS